MYKFGVFIFLLIFTVSLYSEKQIPHKELYAGYIKNYNIISEKDSSVLILDFEIPEGYSIECELSRTSDFSNVFYGYITSQKTNKIPIYTNDFFLRTRTIDIKNNIITDWNNIVKFLNINSKVSIEDKDKLTYLKKNILELEKLLKVMQEKEEKRIEIFTIELREENKKLKKEIELLKQNNVENSKKNIKPLQIGMGTGTAAVPQVKNNSESVNDLKKEFKNKNNEIKKILDELDSKKKEWENSNIKVIMLENKLKNAEDNIVVLKNKIQELINSNNNFIKNNDELLIKLRKVENNFAVISENYTKIKQKNYELESENKRIQLKSGEYFSERDGMIAKTSELSERLIQCEKIISEFNLKKEKQLYESALLFFNEGYYKASLEKINEALKLNGKSEIYNLFKTKILQKLKKSK